MSVITTENLIKYFPNPSIPPISGRPEHETIAEVHLKLNADAAFIHSNRGHVKLYLLCLTYKPKVCDTLSAIKFAHPTNHGSNLDMPEKSSCNEINSIRRDYDMHLK